MNPVQERSGFLVRHPRFFVIFAFGLLLVAWSSLITIAFKLAPELVETGAPAAPSGFEFRSGSRNRDEKKERPSHAHREH